MDLLGRARECALLDGLIRDIRRGESRSLVLRGEAGIGKTALLEYLIAAASDLMVVRAAGVESEMELAYAGLHQLCGPLLYRLESLPGPQCQALEIVFGLSAGGVPDRFTVALAVLSLLSEVSEERPVLCVVDDVQWLDQTSALALGFVARRLLAEPVGLVFAAREPGDQLRHLPELEVSGLHDGDARALLSSAVRFRLDEQVRDRIVAETRGSPLALLELPRSLSDTELAGFGRAAVSELANALEEGFRRRIAALPEQTRRLLLIAAADPLGEPILLRRAAELQGISAAAAAPALEAGLGEFGVRVRFRHPLVRAAAYGAGSLDERRRAHAAIAEVTDAEADPDRRAWHRALACPGPDEAVADELERSAVRARARGGQAAAAAFLERAADLTLDPARRAGRALAAAEARYLAGSGEDALRLAAVADRGLLNEPQRVRVDVLRGRLATMQRRPGDAPPLLLRAAQRLEGTDRRLSRDTYRDAFIAAIYAGRFAGDTGLPRVAAAIRAAVPSTEPPSATDELLDAAALLVDAGYETGTAAVRRALAAFRLTPIAGERDLHWLFLAGRVSMWIWDHETWDALSGRMLTLVRETGVLALEPFADAARVGWELFAGDLAAVSAYVEEQDRVQEAIGGDSSPGSRVILAAYRGHETEVARLDEATTRDAVARGDGPWVAMLNWSTAVLYNGLGRYDEALRAAQLGAAYPPDMHMSSWALSELVEAAARCGQPEAAAGALGRLAEMARACRTDWILGVEARARALMASPADADGLHRQAIECLSRTRFRTELARAQLLYGEWLRRAGRRGDARAQLRAAYDEFSSIGMEGFAERARGELAATGEKVRKRTTETRDVLTAQERQIAELARDGLSNPEIGARLFLSRRTVQYHLAKVFAKLGIRSRLELARALALAQRRERGPDLGREQPGLFPGGEVAAPVGLVEVGEVGVGLLDPATRGPEDLVGERGEADRELDLRARLPRRDHLGLCALPIRPGRRGPGAGQPVHRDVVEDVVAGEASGRLPVDEGAGDLVVAVGVVVEHPGRQGDG
jgi:DNA-binding CsgD family transcriptional regulator